MKCRFAPSPTGKIHLGNTRSALLNWAYAKINNGKFILRIDDTDTKRSSKENELSIKEDLKWLGLDWQKTFNQSTRINLYNSKIEKLKKDNRIYPCFETLEELSLKKKALLSSGKPPIYDRSSLNLSKDDINSNIKNGKKPHWRFKLNDKRIFWTDLIKGDVSFESKNLSDPILIREDGSMLYHLPSVIDDIDSEITDIIRGEDHITNTAYHIQIFDALEGKIPNFAHHPFLTDEQGRGFAKRLGSMTIEKLRKEGYENITLLNYLLFIGSSKDIAVLNNVDHILKNFNISDISNSSAKFSIDVLKSLNSNILKEYKYDQIESRLNFIENKFYKETFWNFSKNNLNFFSDTNKWFNTITKIIKLDDYNFDSKLINSAIENIPQEPFDENTWNIWTNEITKITGIKGKDLFLPLRIILTGLEKGPELKYFMPLINKEIILRKFGKL
ncbi:MAG: glutamate--tRNA ligase [Pelagibacteraceae bacterium]|nr:glutamate--tRNA ligase [Pelagibacteraceae bacterium]|tara:strand:- start:33353 stop:34687 length:1335 start_codon:yes stop_codon:yes gene_type:complete